MSMFKDGSYSSVTGIALIGKVLAGRCKIRYTKAEVGNGIIPDGMTPKTMIGPAGYVMDAKITAVTNPVDGECQVTVQIKSDDVLTGFHVTNIVLYAEDPDKGEVPYTYLSLENAPEWIRPASSIVGKLATFDLIATVGSVDTVTAIIDPEAIATVGYTKQAVAEHNTSESAHANLFSKYLQYRVVSERIRDPAKPDYGLGGGGDEVVPVTMEVGSYTGNAEVTVIVNGNEYDGKNISQFGASAPDNTLIISKKET